MNYCNKRYSPHREWLPKIVLVLFPCWILLQVILLCLYWDFPLHDDAEAYTSIALECIRTNTWYPTGTLHLNAEYLFAPGYINLLIAVGRLAGDLAVIKIVNLFLNVTLALEVYYLARKLFNTQTAYLSLILYCMLYSNWFLAIAPLSDLPFVWCMATSVCAVVYRKWYSLAIAGLLLAAGNWIRPLAIVFLVPLAVYMYTYRYKVREYALTGAFLLLTVFAVGKSTEQRLGAFSFQSTTSGINLAMSSFKEANGLVNFGFMRAEHFRPYISQRDSLTYREKDRMLKELSLQWILDHPYEYLRQIPLKLVVLYSMDTWPERVLPGKGLYDTLPGLTKNPAAFFAFAGGLVLKSLCFYIVLILFIAYLWAERKRYFRKENVFLLVPVLGTLATLPFVVTERYHYPFLPFLIVYAAFFLSERLPKNKKNVSSNT